MGLPVERIPKVTDLTTSSMQSNQPPSSNETPGQKSAVYIPTTENLAGNQSGVSDTAGRGAVAQTYAGPTGNDGINGTASTENLSAKYKYPRVSEDIPAAGRNQYQMK